MRVITFSPLSTPLALKAGLDPLSPFYDEILDALPRNGEALSAPNRERERRRRDYAKTGEDSYDARLVVWRPPPDRDGAEAIFHIYPNAVAIAQVFLPAPEATTAADIETEVQARTRDVIGRRLAGFNALIGDLLTRLPAKYRAPAPDETPSCPDDITWIARALVFTEEERAAGAHRRLVEDWLVDTIRPEDAVKVNEGALDHSITWLNYVIVERSEKQITMLCDALRIAQFYYSAQETLNREMQLAVSRAHFTGRVRKAEARLQEARASMQALRIQYGVHKGLINRGGRRVIDELMTIWEFDELAANGARMVDAASAKLNEIATKRAERGSFVTDLILVGIGLLAVIEVSVILTQYSREVMSRPALEYQDSEGSRILSLVASVETDAMLLGGAFAILILVLIYAYWKRSR